MGESIPNAKRILSRMRRAVHDYDMIQPGDSIAVGVSAGKDSLTLLCALAQLRRFYPKPFSLMALTLEMRPGGCDLSAVGELCSRLDVPYHIIPTDIFEIIFDIRKEKNPCSLCANLRRGILNSTAKSLGANKVALGHHYDDVLETFIMNLLHEGRLGVFSPVTYLDRADITVIRPMIYVSEKEVRRYASQANLPVVHNPCPANGATERQNAKELIAALSKQYPGVKERIFGAVKRGNLLK